MCNDAPWITLKTPALMNIPYFGTSFKRMERGYAKIIMIFVQCIHCLRISEPRICHARRYRPIIGKILISWKHPLIRSPFNLYWNSCIKLACSPWHLKHPWSISTVFPWRKMRIVRIFSGELCEKPHAPCCRKPVLWIPLRMEAATYRPKYYFWLKLARIEMKVDACDCRSMMIWNCNFAFAIPPQNSHCMGPAHFIMHRTRYKVWHQKVDGKGQYGENSTFIDVTEVWNPRWQMHGQIKNKSQSKICLALWTTKTQMNSPDVYAKKNWCKLLW